MSDRMRSHRSFGAIVRSLVMLAVLLAQRPSGVWAGSSPSPITAPASGAGELAVVDVMPAFFDTWDTDGDKPMAQRVAAFRAKVIAPHLDIFVRVGSLSDDAIAAYLQSVAPDVPQMRMIAQSLPGKVASEVARFQKRYPAFVPSATLLVMPSFFHFNGQVRFAPPSRFAVAFGIDALARERPDDAHLAVEIDHELFHVYHGQRQSKLSSDRFESGIPIYFEAWGEGLAAYASVEMNPPFGEREAIGAALADAPKKTQMAVACYLEVHLDGVDPSDTLQLFTGGSAPRGLPDRGAYLVGFLAAQELARASSVTELADLHDAEIGSEVAREVRKQCAGANR